MVDLKNLPPENVWYAIGYITADGNLSPDGRHINITSKDIGHLRKIRNGLSLTNKIGRKARYLEREKKYGVFTFGDVHFYRYLQAIGLRPNKSLTLGPLQIPAQHFRDFLRGLIDGDGSIHRWIHPQNGNEQWELRIFSAAPKFARWIHLAIEKHFEVKGVLILQRTSPPRHTMFRVKFGKMAARKILTDCYYENALSLGRKQRLAKKCIESYVGWTRSLTVR